MTYGKWICVNPKCIFRQLVLDELVTSKCKQNITTHKLQAPT